MQKGSKLSDAEYKRTPMCSRYEDLLKTKNKNISPFQIETLQGITADWILSKGLQKPVLVSNARQTLGLKLPPPSTTFSDIAKSVGEDFPIKVLGAYMRNIIQQR